MDINFEYHGVSASNRLEVMAAEKLNAMNNKFSFIVNADVYFKSENTSSEETGKICEIRVNIPKSTVFAQVSSSGYENSIAEATREVERQLQKKKGKMKSY